MTVHKAKLKLNSRCLRTSISHTKMMYKYFYDLDEIQNNEFNFQETMSSFLESCKETHWAMGEALWVIEDDP